MEMKWTPIIDGDLSEVPVFEDVLFTIIDEATGEDYVIYDELNPTYLTDGFVVFYQTGTLSREEKVTAWGELPEPFKPGECENCKHWKEWIDEYGDGCAECALIENPPFILPTQNPVKRPCEK